MAAPKGGSRERLLNAAEGLFAEHGYDATSIREIAARSGDTIGTLSHHFRSKDLLLYEVVRRRFHELGEMRREKYREFVSRNGGTKPTLEEVIKCIIIPFVERALCGGQEWKSYIELLGRMMYVGHGAHAGAIADLTDPLGIELLGWLHDAAPEALPEDLAHAYRFMIGSMIDACSEFSACRVGRISGEAESMMDAEATKERLILFVTAGVAAVLDNR
ncbi:MAG: TetR/AcrR family transcriptional regulator [Sphingomicrobium sp.]